MIAERDFYEVLQVHPSADPEVIDSAYRRLALKHHPDKGGSADRMSELNRAYAILRDPIERARYDATRAERRDAPAGTSEQPPTAPGERAQSPSPVPAAAARSPWRWLLVVPAAFGGSWLGAALVAYVIERFGPPMPYSFLQRMCFTIVWSAALSASGIAGAAITAPSYQRAVATCFGTLYVLLAGFLLYPALEHADWWGAFAMITSGVASIATTLRLRDALS
jgi:hypothetical protein